MSMVLVIVAVAVVFVSACLAVMRLRPTRAAKKAAAEEVLREQYRRYMAASQALAERRLLTAPADAEWLDGIRARALAADAEQPPVPGVASRDSLRCTLWRRKIWLAGAIPLLTIGVRAGVMAFLILMIGIFVIGVLIGVLMVSAVRREAHRGTLTAAAPDLARGARRLTGLGTGRLPDHLDRGSAPTAEPH
jgi:hypothetical protein